MPSACVVSMVSTSPSRVVLAPSRSSMFTMVVTSRRSGTLEITLLPRANKAAAINGSTAFLAPSTRTLPESGVGPSTMNLSIELLSSCHDAIAAGKILNHENLRKSRATDELHHGVGLGVANLEHDHSARGKARAEERHDAAVEVESVGATVERQHGLVLAHFARQPREAGAFDVGRIAENGGELFRPFLEIAECIRLHDAHAGGHVVLACVERRQFDRVGGNIHGGDVKIADAVGERDADDAASAAQIER